MNGTLTVKRLLVLLIIQFLNDGNTSAQNNKIVIGETAKIHSKVLNEDRSITVYVPPDYKLTQTKYPVVYLLDGPDHFHHVTGIVRFLAQQGLMPDMVVVGIHNTDRTRDLTPKPDSSDKQLPTAGGSDQFLQFLTDELKPFVQKKYRTDPFEILIGHSFGGLFAVHTMLNTPDVFDAYIAVSPSLWWNKWEEVKHAESFLRSHRDFKKMLYVTLGNEGIQMQSPMDSFVTVLEKNAPPGFSWKYQSMDKENHGTTPHRSIYDGLEWMYTGWSYPLSAAFKGLAGLEQHYAGLSERFGYKIEPSERIINSLGYVLLGNLQTAEAIKIFQFNISSHPESANVYDSMADAYEAFDEMELALKNCEQACLQGKKISDPNLAIYQKHLEKIKIKMGKKI
ncbi:alpha/beta hydrolase [bacterium]|nr:alpha/beta hydrolase [bacterium]